MVHRGAPPSTKPTRFQLGGGSAGFNLHCPTLSKAYANTMYTPAIRGLHSSSFRLNFSAFCGMGGAFRVCLRGCL